MPNYQTIGIIAKPNDARATVTLDHLITILRRFQKRGEIQQILSSSGNAHSDADDAVERVPVQSIATRCQMVIVIGGDGTLLSAARTLAYSRIPILGINQGRLGFLVEIPPVRIEQAVDAALSGSCKIEERLILSARVRRGDGSYTEPHLAINDVVIRNLASIRMLEFETWFAEEFISRHRADGLIVSTPTGSTAYALSSGGPILHPDLSALSLVPICPHTLTDRPIAVPSSQMIRIIPRSGSSDGASVTCDGQIATPLHSDDVIEITPLPGLLRLLHTRDYSYFGVLRDKLLWGRGAEFEASQS